MPRTRINGDEAMALGAFHSGVKVVSSYPGSPSSGTVDALVPLAEAHGIHLEWSSNEKVAMELGIGASIAGRRALVCTKSVGLNAMLDPIMALNLTPVHGGLVLLLGDDPGGYGSQNDQDSRPMATLMELPWLEPATPAEAFTMIQDAFEASEQLQMPIVLRVTRSFTQQSQDIDLPEGTPRQPDLGFLKETWRFVPVPRNVVAKHRELHQRLETAQTWTEGLPYNQVLGDGHRGIVASGFAFTKLLDVIGPPPWPDLKLLKLSALFPLPEALLSKFLSGCEEVLVLEENEPFVEDRLKALAHDHQLQTRFLGKRDGLVSREGELYRWQIRQTISRFIPTPGPLAEYLPENEAKELPLRENYCAGCRYDVVLDALQEVASELGQEMALIGDPGCLVTVADRLDAKYAIGSAVGVADGLSKAGFAGRAVALFGDSSFFHTSLPAICNAVVNRSNILMIVLDNGATVTSGLQPNPGVGRDALGRPAPKLLIEQIARACGVPFVLGIDTDERATGLREPFREALSQQDLALLVIRVPYSPPSD